MSARTPARDAILDSETAALAGTTRSPIVDPGGVTFVYHGAADAVNLRCWIHGLPASQPFERVGEADLWVLRVELPESSRIEYKFEVVRDGREEWILDPLNPLQAVDPFGANSVAQGHGYQRPEWTLAGSGGAAGHARRHCAQERRARRRPPRHRVPAGALPPQPALPAAGRARRRSTTCATPACRACSTT